MKPAMAIKTWLSTNATTVDIKEFTEFYKSLTKEEKEEYARVSADELGVELD